MGDRDKLLDAIRAKPDEDTPRLMLADWLDEYGEGDRDAATVEFIRLSCSMRNTDIMPQAAYRWLLDTTYAPDDAGARVQQVKTANWRRLVPAMLAEHYRLTPTGTLKDCRDGRRVWCELRLLIPTALRTKADPLYRATPVNLWFRRGFCEGFRVCHAGARALLAPLVCADQPLAKVRVPNVDQRAADLMTREAK